MSEVSAAPVAQATQVKNLTRKIGLFQAVTINMSQMCGIGPFVTIPLMVSAFGGPQAIIGWVAGAILALADGLIWAELGSALPGSGGTYVYLREAFQYRSGKLMPFLFIWTAILFIPLTMSTGIQGMVQYLTYLWPSMTMLQGDVVGIGLTALLVLALWRRVENIGRMTVGMWAVMIVCVCTVIIASFSHFHASQAFTWPHGAVEPLHGSFWIGFAAGLTVGVFDYLGYNTTAYLGAEIKQPGRVMPRSIIYSIAAIGGIYIVMQIGVLGVVPWHDMLNPNSIDNTSIGAAVLQDTWGRTAAKIVTVLVCITAFASVFTGLLGGSRVPFDAARDGMFFRSFGRLHKKHEFPTVGLVVMGVMTAAGFLFARYLGSHSAHPPLTVLISLLTTVMVLVQSMAQIAAVSVLRKRQPNLRRPYKMLLYPLPSVVAGAGWATIYLWADKANPGVHPIEWSLAWLALGCVAFLIWSAKDHVWPFGPKEIREQFMNEPVEEIEPEPVG